MTRQYAPKSFLRQVPFPLLREFLDREGIPNGIDWDAVGEADVGGVYDAWLALPVGDRERAEQMFRAVHDLATPHGTRLLVDEAAFHGEGIGDALDAVPSYHGKALWVLLRLPVVFHHVSRVAHADQLPGRYWRTTTGVPAVPIPAPLLAAHDLSLGLARYFREAQGRGQRVTVEPYLRAGGDHYFFCYPDDYTHTHVGHDRAGTLRRVPQRPAFEVVFVYAPGAGTLDLYAPGDRAVRAALEEVFCKAVLQCLPPAPRPKGHAYELNRLLDPAARFPTEPADRVVEVRVRRLRVALPTPGRRVVLEVDANDRPDGVFELLDEMLDPARYPRDRLNVTLATIVLRVAPTGSGRERTVTFDVGYPDSCSLKSRSEDDRALGEKYLRAWGIARD